MKDQQQSMTDKQALNVLWKMAENATSNGRDHRLKDQAYQQLLRTVNGHDESEHGDHTD